MNKTRDVTLLILPALGISFLLSLVNVRRKVVANKKRQKTIYVSKYELVPQ
jgi:hypothetical protein